MEWWSKEAGAGLTICFGMADAASDLSAEDVRKVARLARLEVADDKIDEFRLRLGAVLGYVERLRELDLKGVEPLAHAGEAVHRLRDDAVADALDTRVLTEMTPESMGAFVKVPKVLGDGGGA